MVQSYGAHRDLSEERNTGQVVDELMISVTKSNTNLKATMEEHISWLQLKYEKTL